MHVVVHKDIGVDAAAGSVLIDCEGKEVLLEIGGILEHALFLVSPDDDVVEGAGELDARFAGHGVTIAEWTRDVNIPAFQV
jgi:hypothetical protein